MANGNIFEAIKDEFSQCGYNVFSQLFNARDFGVPQDRERVIIVGIRKDFDINDFSIPVPKNKRMTMREALAGMPEPSPDDICNAPYSSRYMSRNRKRGWDDVSYTIPAMAKQVTLHPSSPDMEKLGKDLWKFGDNGITRRFSWQEAAAIQTFPRGLKFEGDLVSKYKQVGNAVPVKLAEHVATFLYEILTTKESEKWQQQEYRQNTEKHLSMLA
jgi:DNA (cytosine-5)-methyltransferase 1